MAALQFVSRWAQRASLWVTLVTTGCGAHVEAPTPPAGAGKNVAPTAACPARLPAAELLPNVQPEHETLSYWLEVWKHDLDAPLLSSEALSVHDRALRTARDGDARVVDLTRVPSREELTAALERRFAVLHERFASREYVSEQPNALALLDPSVLAGFVSTPKLHVALAPVSLRCAPFAPAIRSTTGTPGIDRNSCSRARAQEPIEILGTLGQSTLARTREALGFLDGPARASLSPEVPAELAAQFREGKELELLQGLSVAGRELPAASMLIARDADTAWLASETGFDSSPPLGDRARSASRPLTRRAFLEAAFRYLGGPYGWGDQNGGRDCSRLVLDVLRSFGIHLPRHSAEQSRAGTYALDVPESASETERLSLLDEAAARGVVLVHFPGHIMLYLGRDLTGTPRALHAFAEYLSPCPGGGETLFEVNRVSVSDLTLGKGTSRRSFLERATRITVLGRPPGPALLALASFRAPVPPSVPESCNDSLDAALFRSPRDPHARAPMRVVAVTSAESRPAGLWLVDPRGELVAAEVHELGTGPFGRFVEVPQPTPGRWTALLADGERVLACEHIRVAEGPPAPPPARAEDQPAWQTRVRWERDTEHLYSAFVEQLFSHPLEDMRTWSSLSELLRDPARNLLFDHLSQAEDTRLRMRPDCADLPYFLRAYFAFKLGLPFAFRQCSRGRAGVPPRCTELKPNSLPVTASDEVSAFEAYLRQYLASGVHSASGRTLPSDDATDFYPLPLTHEALAPGSVFADPYGHVIVLAKWVPQGLFGSGMLVGADAQPDASIGRRRFFRGNFLFTPDTRDVGAGFKGFRPLIREPDGTITSMGEQSIRGSADFPAPSLAQYEGSADDFYTRMDELIYPRPIAMTDRLKQVVDALEEQVVRRVDAIDLGEAFMNTQRAPIQMPAGYDLFETTGAWEDFATPSRDMRLLIALDTVRDFPRRVAAQPDRFGVTPTATLEVEVRALLDAELATRRFRYTRSDGTPAELSLADVLSRAASLEVAYNPNDCVETRWGALSETAEAAPCRRKAPAAQRALMEKNRAWFHTRTRPPRP